MPTGQYISVREAAQMLSITEKKVMDLLDEKELIGYRIANQFLRLKREEVLLLQRSGNVETEIKLHQYTLTERINDFFYYNDFYLVSCLIILGLLYVILYF